MLDMAGVAAPVAVAVQGLSPGAVGTWTGVVILVAALVKAWPHLRKLTNESDASLRHDLMERIDKLEKQQSDERRECDRQMTELHSEIRGLRDELAGVMRQLITYQVAEARRGNASVTMTPQMLRAVDSLENIARSEDMEQ